MGAQPMHKYTWSVAEDGLRHVYQPPGPGQAGLDRPGTGQGREPRGKGNSTCLPSRDDTVHRKSKGGYNVGHKLGLEEALDIAMDAELKAQAFYSWAAVEVQDPHGRDLLGRLAAFEQYHYEQLAKLARSLQADGRFIDYEPRTVEQFYPLFARGETTGTQLQELKGVANILDKAISNEKTAGERYRALAEETADKAGQDMFRNLAHEEMVHQRILEDEFFSLSNQGGWKWAGMYGE
jgi:rubrerythrin